jgi:hypothetical protein
VEAAGAVDAKSASTAPWKTAKNAVSHSYHRPLLFPSVPEHVLPMFPVNSVTYLPGCTGQSNRRMEPTQIFTSWNRIADWLRYLDGLKNAA